MALLGLVLGAASTLVKSGALDGVLTSDQETETSEFTKFGNFQNAGLFNRTAAGFAENKTRETLVDDSAKKMVGMGLDTATAISNIPGKSPNKDAEAPEPGVIPGVEQELNDLSLESAGIDNTYDPMKSYDEAVLKEFNLEDEDYVDDIPRSPYRSTGTSGIFNNKISF